MESAISTIKLSQTAKDQLIKLKRTTKIKHWNVLCRWAFALSLADESIPSPVNIPLDSNVEMTWNVFGGDHASTYLLALKNRLMRDGLPTDASTIQKYFKLHLHRGIGSLSSKNINNITSLYEFG